MGQWLGPGFKIEGQVRFRDGGWLGSGFMVGGWVGFRDGGRDQVLGRGIRVGYWDKGYGQGWVSGRGSRLEFGMQVEVWF